MLLGLMLHFPTDPIERAIDSTRAATELLQQKRPDILHGIAKRRALFLAHYGESVRGQIEKAENAILIAIARMASRHGTLGHDFHHYHNEDHVMELLDRRLGRVLDVLGVARFSAFDWLALSMFAACHDLRQRETLDFEHAIGNNEAASIAETMRILHLADYDRELDANLFIALEVMIAGSTFDARPPKPSNTPLSTAEAVQNAGPLAWKLADELDKSMPEWREHPIVSHALELALVASDIDTANVGEDFELLCESGRRLALEREMRLGRSIDHVESGAPVLGFLTDGQMRYFFDLHRFCSTPGREVFADQKAQNASRLIALCAALKQQFVGRAEFTGREVLEAQMGLAKL